MHVFIDTSIRCNIMIIYIQLSKKYEHMKLFSYIIHHFVPTFKNEVSAQIRENLETYGRKNVKSC